MKVNKLNFSKNTIRKNSEIIIFFIITTIVALLSIFNLFKKLDYRFYDLLLSLSKQPAQTKQILHVNIDDESIAELGEWPWSRDIIADSLIHMKELGAKTAVFDVEYLSPSPMGVPSNSSETIEKAFQNQEDEINNIILQLSQAVKSGQIRPSEISGVTEDMLSNYVNPSILSLKDSILENAYQDNDEYFGRAIQFFGNAWLTINTRDVIIKVPEDEKAYAINRHLLKNVTDEKNFIERDNNYTSKEQYAGLQAGFSPALHQLLKRASGIGFTNVIIDVDGTRRRIELLYKNENAYAGQLVFSPLLNYLNVEKITRNKKNLILHNATFPNSDKKVDIKIPLDNHGRMFINWLHTSFADSFRHESVYFLKQLELIENDISGILANLSGFVLRNDDGSALSYAAMADELYYFYQDILDEKRNLLSLCSGFDENGNAFDGISDEMYEHYFSERKQYFELLTDYVNSDFITEVENRLSELSSQIKEDERINIIQVISEELEFLKENITTYNEMTEEMKKSYKDSFCIIGNTASSTTDNGATPFVRLYPNVGTHANVINTILQQNFIKYVPWGFMYCGIAFLIVAVLLISHSKPTKEQNIYNAVVLLAVLILPFVLMCAFKIYYLSISTYFMGILVFFSGIILRYVKSSNEKKFITQIAASFANKDTVDQLTKNPEAFKTEGQSRFITALFSDIQKFSSFSESISKIYGEEGPNKLIEFLNEYLGAMSNEILINNGNIDKYEGDAIISMFGAPDPLNVHNENEWSYLSLDSAVRMKKVEVEFNKVHSDLFRPYEIEENGEKKIIELKPLQTRIGLNSGNAYVGLMGSKTASFSKLNYTMIGDTVNLASRLEGVNKQYSTWIMCSDDTWNKADTGDNQGKLIARKLDKVRVVGRSTPVQLYNVLGFKDDISERQFESLEKFNKALDLYLNRNFVEACRMFVEANKINPEDKTSLVFAERCKLYAQKGVPENWDGVMNLVSK